MAKALARVVTLTVVTLFLATWNSSLRAQDQADDACHGLIPGSTVPQPEDLRSKDGELRVDLTIRNYAAADGSFRYCYSTKDGKAAPNLRLKPGDLLILNLTNRLKETSATPKHHHGDDKAN